MSHSENGGSLLIVLGAGASCEVNLPIGVELKKQIAGKLNIVYRHGYERISGDALIDNAYRQIANSEEYRGNINPLLEMSRRISNAMPQAISIDNFIDSHRNQPLIAVCGKLAITRCILEAEAHSLLKVDDGNIYNTLSFEAIENTWFNYFFQLVTENCPLEEVANKLSKIKIISFNYDRCIEHYLYLALQNYYAIKPELAAEILNSLHVFHPYGKVGSLPWMSNDGIAYGSEPNSQQLISISQQIRTFTEGMNSEQSDIELIRDSVLKADRVLFLGFAFHRLNLDLLFSGISARKAPKTVAIYATALNLSQSDANQIRYELSDKAKYPYDGINIRTDLTCAKLFQEYWRSLSIR